MKVTSTDNTKQVVDAIQKKYPDRKIEFISHPKNIGNYNNFRKTQELATNRYTAIFHDDDIIHPEYIEFALKALSQNPTTVMVSGFLKPYLNPDNHNWDLFSKKYILYPQKDNSFLSLLLYRWNFAAMIYKTSAYKKVSYRPDVYGKLMDIPFLLEIGSLGDSIFIPDFVFRYRSHPGADSSNPQSGPFIDEIIETIKIYKNGLKKHPLLGSFLLFQFAVFIFRWSQIKAMSEKKIIKTCIKNEIFSNTQKFFCCFFISKKILKKILHFEIRRKRKKYTHSIHLYTDI